MEYTQDQSKAIEEISSNFQNANTKITGLAAEVVVLSIYKDLTPSKQIFSDNVLKEIPLKDGSIKDFEFELIINNVVEGIVDYFKKNNYDQDSIDIDDETAEKIKTVGDVANEAYKMLEPALNLDIN